MTDDLLNCLGFTKHYQQWGWTPVEHGIMAALRQAPEGRQGTSAPACEWTEQQIGEAVAVLYAEGTLDLKLCDWIDHTLQTARAGSAPAKRPALVPGVTHDIDGNEWPSSARSGDAG